MLLQHATWPEVEVYLGQSRGVVVPVGSTEQHGPSGLIGTDAICAEAIARGVGEATGAMVAPVIGVGMALHHMAFPGSMTLRPSTLILVVREWVLSLAQHGFTRFLFVNGHGGNVPTVRAAFYEIYSEWRALRGAEAPDLRCRLVNWWENAGVGRLSESLFGPAEGSHATPSEISVTQYLLPDSARSVALEPAVAPSGPFFDARDLRRRYPDGRIGSAPALASPEHGRRLYDAAVTALAETYRSFLAER
ncbi:MAG: creatininase family protein [Azospirillum sp.]|nr:creatininase family protein [Azospirillum sp.]